MDTTRGQDAPPPLRLGPLEFDVRSWVYGTITLMSVLVVYEGWGELRSFAGVVLAVVLPTVALALAHLFSDVLDHQVDTGRTLTVTQFWHLAGHAAQFLLVAVPPLVLLQVMWVLQDDVEQALRWMVPFGGLSLGFWGLVAGRRVGYRGWRLLAAAVAGLLIGGLVIACQIVFKPH